MEIEVKKEITEKVELKLPYYFKTGAHWVGIINDEEAVLVTDCCGALGLKYDTAEATWKQFDWCNEKIEITAEEFHSKMLEVINEFTVELHNVGATIKNQFIENVSKTDLEG